MANAIGSRVVRQPLVQFLALGFVIYLGFTWLGPERKLDEQPVSGDRASLPASDRRIVVEREALLAFVQSRTQQPDARSTARAFDALDTQQRRSWIDRFVREEALVREAISLGLDRDDELIRRRLVQKMEFLTLGVAEGELVPGDAEIEAFYQAHAAEYRVPAMLSFAHVFVRDRDDEKDSQARARAVEILGQLNGSQVGQAEALPLGDRFLYNRHYVDRTLDEVRSHFGEAMAGWFESAEPGGRVWQGPIRSDHGWHLVLLSMSEKSRVPPYAEIATRLEQDLAREKSERALDAGLERIVSGYRVELGEDLREH